MPTSTCPNWIVLYRLTGGFAPSHLHFTSRCVRGCGGRRLRLPETVPRPVMLFAARLRLISIARFLPTKVQWPLLCPVTVKPMADRCALAHVRLVRAGPIFVQRGNNRV